MSILHRILQTRLQLHALYRCAHHRYGTATVEITDQGPHDWARVFIHDGHFHDRRTTAKWGKGDSLIVRISEADWTLILD